MKSIQSKVLIIILRGVFKQPLFVVQYKYNKNPYGGIIWKKMQHKESLRN